MIDDGFDDGCRCYGRKISVQRLAQSLWPSFVALSPLFLLIASVALLEANGIQEYLFHGRDGSFVRGKDCEEECSKEKSAGYVLFLEKAVQLAQKTRSLPFLYKDGA